MSGVLLQLLSLSVSAPVARDSTTRRSVFRQGKRRYEVASGRHDHDIPGEIHWIISNVNLQSTTQLRNAGIISNREAVLNGSYVVSAKDAPKLALLWGSTGGNVNWPDLRDRTVRGAGNIFDSGATEGLAYGAARSDRANRIHGHANTLAVQNTAHNTVSNTAATAGADRVVSIGGSTTQHSHGMGGTVSSSNALPDPAIGAIAVVRIQ